MNDLEIYDEQSDILKVCSSKTTGYTRQFFHSLVKLLLDMPPTPRDLLTISCDQYLVSYKNSIFANFIVAYQHVLTNNRSAEREMLRIAESYFWAKNWDTLQYICSLGNWHSPMYCRLHIWTKDQNSEKGRKKEREAINTIDFPICQSQFKMLQIEKGINGFDSIASEYRSLIERALMDQNWGFLEELLSGYPFSSTNKDYLIGILGFVAVVSKPIADKLLLAVKERTSDLNVCQYWDDHRSRWCGSKNNEKPSLPVSHLAEELDRITAIGSVTDKELYSFLNWFPESSTRTMGEVASKGLFSSCIHNDVDSMCKNAERLMDKCPLTAQWICQRILRIKRDQNDAKIMMGLLTDEKARKTARTITPQNSLTVFKAIKVKKSRKCESFEADCLAEIKQLVESKNYQKLILLFHNLTTNGTAYDTICGFGRHVGELDSKSGLLVFHVIEDYAKKKGLPQPDYHLYKQVTPLGKPMNSIKQKPSQQDKYQITVSSAKGKTPRIVSPNELDQIIKNYQFAGKCPKFQLEEISSYIDGHVFDFPNDKRILLGFAIQIHSRQAINAKIKAIITVPSLDEPWIEFFPFISPDNIVWSFLNWLIKKRKDRAALLSRLFFVSRKSLFGFLLSLSQKYDIQPDVLRIVLPECLRDLGKHTDAFLFLYQRYPCNTWETFVSLDVFCSLLLEVANTVKSDKRIEMLKEALSRPDDEKMVASYFLEHPENRTKFEDVGIVDKSWKTSTSTGAGKTSNDGKLYLDAKSVVLVSNKFSCVMNGHPVEHCKGFIPYFENGIIQYIEVPILYCRKCKNHYSINDIDFRNSVGFRENQLLCRFAHSQSDYNRMLSGSFDLSSESFLHKCGYNVNATIGLTSRDRQSILSALIEKRVVPPSEVVEYLHYFITYNGRKDNMEQAVEKWSDDADFVTKTYLLNSHSRKVQIQP